MKISLRLFSDNRFCYFVMNSDNLFEQNKKAISKLGNVFLRKFLKENESTITGK